MTRREIVTFIKARHEAWLDQLELHTIGAFNGAVFATGKKNLDDLMPHRGKVHVRTAEEEGARHAAWARGINQKFAQREQAHG